MCWSHQRVARASRAPLSRPRRASRIRYWPMHVAAYRILVRVGLLHAALQKVPRRVQVVSIGAGNGYLALKDIVHIHVPRRRFLNAANVTALATGV
jgi:hypothetical protein